MNLNDLLLEDLEFLLGYFYGSAWSRYRDEGLADTACKMLCGLNVHKGRTPEQVAQHQQHQQQDPAAARVRWTALALRRLGRVWTDAPLGGDQAGAAGGSPGRHQDDVRGNTGRGGRRDERISVARIAPPSSAATAGTAPYAAGPSSSRAARGRRGRAYSDSVSFCKEKALGGGAREAMAVRCSRLPCSKKKLWCLSWARGHRMQAPLWRWRAGC